MFFFEESIQYTHRDGDHVIPHTHSGYEVILYSTGSGTMSAGNEELRYLAESICIIPRKVCHYEHTERSTMVYACVMDTDFFSVSEPLLLYGPQYAPYTERLRTLFCALHEAAMREHWSPGEPKANEILGKIAYVVSFLLELSNARKPSALIVSNTKKYIQSNFRHTISFPILAENVGYSYERFRHIFKDSVGIGLKQYLLGVRLNHAKNLLHNTSYKIKDISERCGFKYPEQFMGYFKKTMGMSPMDYRKECKKASSDRVFNVNDKEPEN